MLRTIFTLFLVAIVNMAFAQKINITEENNTLSVGSVNTICVTVYGMSYGDVEKAWKKQLKDWNGDVKAKKEIFADNCLIKDMSANTFDVYTIFKEVDGGIKIISAFDLGGAYLSSVQHKDEFAVISKKLYEFGVEQTKEAISGDIKIAENDKKDLEKEKDDFEKDIKNLEKEIEDYKQKIEEAKAKIEEDKKSIETKKEEISAKEEVIKALENKKNAVK